MEPVLVLVVLALGLSVLLQAVDELVPFRTPAAVTHLVAVAIGAGLAWLLGYSVFTSFGQEVRAEWLHPIATGLVLVGVAEFVRSTVSAIARRSDQPQTQGAPTPAREPRAA